MKKTNKLFTYGRVYTGLTVLASLVMVYLNVAEDYSIPWYWITAPLWGSFVAAMCLVGISFTIVSIWGKDIDLSGTDEHEN
jgi:hypothetical protein